LVVDSHPLVRDGLNRVLSHQHDLICCGEAGTVPDALAAVAAQRPELVIMDLRLKGGDGLALIRSLKAQYPALLILVCSHYDEPILIENALKAGARGYLFKERGANEVVSAARAVLAGEVYWAPIHQ
jgi:DNA-binding NarL/FixJ family response regulator